LFARLLPLVLLLVTTPALAFKPATKLSYQIVPSGGKYTFVMMSGNADDPLKLRQKYPKNGLYRNDDQRELLWSVDWLAPREGIFLAEDGVHLIRWETWPHFPDRGHNLGREAVSFHANGKLLRS
jgi:hypothetical protein